MGQFTPTAFTAGGTDLVDKLNTNFTAVATAHNAHATGDFGAASVPLTALAGSYYTWTADLTPCVMTGTTTGCLVENTLNTTILASYPCPRTATLTAVKGIANAVSSANATFDVFKNGTTVLSAPKALAAADTVYSGTVSVTTAAANDVFTLRCVTGAGETVTDLKVILEFKAQLTT